MSEWKLFSVSVSQTGDAHVVARTREEAEHIARHNAREILDNSGPPAVDLWEYTRDNTTTTPGGSATREPEEKEFPYTDWRHQVVPERTVAEWMNLLLGSVEPTIPAAGEQTEIPNE